MIDNPAPEKTALAMLEYLWSPFSGFAFASDKDRAVALLAIMTAVLRDNLPACPGFAFDGDLRSGKTMLAQCLAVLRSEKLTHEMHGHKTDVRFLRELSTALQHRCPSIVWYNLTAARVWGCPSMGAFLESPMWSYRTPRPTEVHTVENKVLLLATVYRLELSASAQARVLVAKFDDEQSAPLPSSLEPVADPLEQVMDERLALRAAVERIFGAYQSACFRAYRPGDCWQELPGFDVWSARLLPVLAWLAELVHKHYRFGLPRLANPLIPHYARDVQEEGVL